MYTGDWNEERMSEIGASSSSLIGQGHIRGGVKEKR